MLEFMNWSLALVPVLTMLAMFVWLDVFKLMTLWEMLGVLLLGAATGLLAYPVSGVFLDQLPLGYSTYSRFAAPWVEETIKALAIVLLFQLNRIGFKLDAVISGFAIGAGFSVVENIIYLTRFPELAPPTWMVRGLGTAVMHGTTVAIVAAIAHEFAERENREAASDYRFNPLWYVPGLAIAGLLHMGFNQFPDRPLVAMIATLAVAPFLIMALFKFGAQEAQHWLAQDSAVHLQSLAAWRSGGYPDDESGRRIAALVARSDPAAGNAVRDYCEQMTALVLAAETALHDQASEEDKVEIDARASFAAAEAARSAMGRTTFAALRPLLPFSRNDYWEVSELKERLAR
ncbi:PrsW family glutamic-type intramembrane protease [Sphingomonas mesophila]|uniref:PrsW family glutamic-type intramembrane protease n=1 Tax=Sphingomonas mesophila TaxID=2303576 RepID=UPI000E57B253|nr:PrsW family glutamic-type intramembrane protease [Sphingomonas mesophila]